MYRNEGVMLAALVVVVMGVAGCANNEVVKKEEPTAATISKAQAETPKPAAMPQKAATETPKAGQMKPLEATAAKGSVSANPFETVYFGFDRSDLSPAARATLAKNGEALKTHPGAKVRIEGNCDERGSSEYNLALGERRAKSAMQYLVALGVPANRLSVISYGKERPAVQGHDEAAWAKNRRDDFVVQQ